MKKVLVIAEAGVNHNGKMELAYRLIDAAKEAGADVVKFQSFIPEKTISRFAEKATYQKDATGKGESQLEMVKKLALSFDDQRKLLEYCNRKNIQFLSSPFGFESIEFLKVLGMDTFKIPSGEIINLPYMRKVGALNKKIIMSTGMSTIAEVESAIDMLVGSGTARENITLLHCTTNYPCPYDEVNLNAMLTLKEAFKLPVGYSDHTLGMEVSVAAVALGATVVEKHFTLDKKLEGPDHGASLDPDELKAMVMAIRHIETSLGDGVKKPNKSELEIKSIARKSIVAAKPIKKGEVFTEDNITVKRPGTGISPMRWDEIIGGVSQKNYEEDQLI